MCCFLSSLTLNVLVLSAAQTTKYLLSVSHLPSSGRVLGKTQSSRWQGRGDEEESPSVWVSAHVQAPGRACCSPRRRDSKRAQPRLSQCTLDLAHGGLMVWLGRHVCTYSVIRKQNTANTMEVHFQHSNPTGGPRQVWECECVCTGWLGAPPRSVHPEGALGFLCTRLV